MSSTSRVAVLGAGVAGLTAADELSQRNFQVDVYERRYQVGGKARSFLSDPLPGLGDRLPAEHGFRFFPGFYRHLPDTMERIPYRGHSTVAENLVEAHQLALLRSGESETVVPTSIWGFLDPDKTRLHLTRHPFRANFNLSHDDLLFVESKLVELLRKCQERRLIEMEQEAWWDYCQADARSQQSPQYPMMMIAMTRSLVAARAKEISARTGGNILIQLQLAFDRIHGHPDRLLNGPTSDVWIEPWRRKLVAAGVTFKLSHEVTGFVRDGKRVAAVNVTDNAGQRITADGYDWYVSALPVEVMAERAKGDLAENAPSLANLDNLETRWMNGFMLYLRHNFDMVEGHTIYIDSPWALTSVSQAQFWAREHLGWRIPGKVEGILSVDISNWETSGLKVGKPAMQCTAEEIRQEVLEQIRACSQGASWQPYLSDSNIAGYFIDPDIRQPNPEVAAKVNLEPLLINTKRSWDKRPNSHTEIENLVLAADYVRTYTDLATMEGANEAGRRAVNCILEKARSEQEPCRLWPLREPAIFAHERDDDRIKYERDDGSAFDRARNMLEALHLDHTH